MDFKFFLLYLSHFFLKFFVKTFLVESHLKLGMGCWMASWLPPRVGLERIWGDPCSPVSGSQGTPFYWTMWDICLDPDNVKNTRDNDWEHLVLSGHSAVRQKTNDSSVECRTGCAVMKTLYFLQTNQAGNHCASRWVANTSTDTPPDRVPIDGLVTKTSRYVISRN